MAKKEDEEAPNLLAMFFGLSLFGCVVMFWVDMLTRVLQWAGDQYSGF